MVESSRDPEPLSQRAAPSWSGWKGGGFGSIATLPDSGLVRQPEASEVDPLSLETLDFGGLRDDSLGVRC
jgi:hypothetical protein